MNPTRVRRRLTWFALAIGALLLSTAFVAAASLRIVSSSESFGGQESPTSYLADWEETGAAPSTTPTPVPTELSATMAAPTRLATAATSYVVNDGTAGHTALAWSFTQATGLATNLELELSFTLHWTNAGTAETGSVTVYVETQAAAIGAALAFTLFFDAGAATGIVFVSQYELTQSCSAVGTCP